MSEKTEKDTQQENKKLQKGSAFEEKNGPLQEPSKQKSKANIALMKPSKK